LFTYFPLEYIENIFGLTLKLIKKYFDESFFYSKTLQEDILLTKSVLIIRSLCGFCFEELTLKYQIELITNIQVFLRNTTKVPIFLPVSEDLLF